MGYDYSWITVASLNMITGQTKNKTHLGNANIVYVSHNNVYIASPTVVDPERGNNDYTIVIRFQIKNGIIQYRNNIFVPGRILNQFAMDEYNNQYFRIATTVRNGINSEWNKLYIFTLEGSEVGSSDGLAPGFLEPGSFSRVPI